MKKKIVVGITGASGAPYARRLLGVLGLSSDPPRTFADDELEILQLVANQAAAAMENARLYGRAELIAITDGLTGLYNHRAFYERLTQEVKRAQRYELPLSLLMIDIDDFKAFNDRLGHPAGDALLRTLGGLFTAETRQQIDFVARYGGEEFTILLPSTSAHGAAVAGRRLRDRIAATQMAHGVLEERSAGAGVTRGDVGQARVVGERIRHAVESQNFAQREAPLPVTVSIGVAGYPDHGESGDALVAAADAALYRAKALGKNRVEVAEAS